MLVQARFLSLVLLLYFSQQLLLALSFGCQFHQILLDQRNTFTRISDRIVQFATQFLNLLLLIQQVMVACYHLVGLQSHLRFTLGIGPVPTRNILILLLEVCHLPSIVSQIDIRLLFFHRADDDILDEVGI